MKKRLISALMIIVMTVYSLSYFINIDSPSYAYDIIQIANHIRAFYLYDEEGAKKYLKENLNEYSTEDGREANIAILRDFNKLVYTVPERNYYGYEGFGDLEKDDNGQWVQILGYLLNDSTEFQIHCIPI